MCSIDFFKESGTDIVINNEKTMIKSTTGSTYNTAYGTQIIKPKKNKMYLWTFKIDDNDKGDIIHFGINQYSSTSKHIKHLNHTYHDQHNCKHYTLSLSPSSTTKIMKYSHLNINGESIIIPGIENNKIDKLISMKIIFDENKSGSMYFAYQDIKDKDKDNEKKWNLIFKRIDSTINYKMAISIKNGMVEIIDFKVDTFISDKIPIAISSDSVPSNVTSILKRNNDKSGEKKKKKKRVRFDIDEGMEPCSKKRKLCTTSKKNKGNERIIEKINDILLINKQLVQQNQQLRIKCYKYEQQRQLMINRMNIQNERIQELQLSLK